MALYSFNNIAEAHKIAHLHDILAEYGTNIVISTDR